MITKKINSKKRFTTSPIAYIGRTLNNETKLELLLQINIIHRDPLDAIAEERLVLIMSDRIGILSKHTQNGI